LDDETTFMKLVLFRYMTASIFLYDCFGWILLSKTY